MRMTYPRFYQTTQSDEDANMTVDIWYDIFKDDNFDLVKVAVNTLVQTLEFPPTIADVRKQMSKLVGTASNEDLAIDEWNKIRQAIKSSGYYAKENFDNLPEIAKRFVGTPQQLRDWAIGDGFNSEVLRSQFLKQYDTLKERRQYEAELQKNTELQTLLGRLTNQKVLEAKDEA